MSMAPKLDPNPSDTTNALLKILINEIRNGTFPEQEASLPVWKGPSSTIMTVQTLGYIGLSISLFVAVCAMLQKQSLALYTKSCVEKDDSLDERCKQRQRELDRRRYWKHEVVLSMMPVFLQVALLLLALALLQDFYAPGSTSGPALSWVFLCIIFFLVYFSVASFAPPVPF